MDALAYNLEKEKFYNGINRFKNILQLKNVILEGNYGILPPSNTYNESNEIKLIRATELKEGLEIDFENVNYVDKEYYLDRVAIRSGDILLAVKGATIASEKSVAIVKKFTGKAIINGSIFKIRVNRDIANERYIAYILNSKLLKNQMKFSLIANNAVDYLDKNLIEKLQIPIPPLNLQNKIVELYEYNSYQKKEKEKEAKRLLSSIDSYLLDELGIKIPRKDELIGMKVFKSRFSEVSGGRMDVEYNSNYYKEIYDSLNNSKYSIEKVRDVIEDIKTGTTPTKYDDCFTDNKEIVFLRNTNLEKYQINLDKVKYIKYAKKDKLVYSLKNEVIVCIAGTVGISAPNHYDKEISINQNISSLKFSERVNPEFAAFWFNTELFLDLTRRACSVATILYLNNTNLKNMPIPILPRPKQDEIVEHINSIRNKAKRLEVEAKEIMENTKLEIEKMILEG